MIPIILLGAAYLIGKTMNGKSYVNGGKLPLLAPNGLPSKLTQEQWHLVRTPEFKAWFGDWENDADNASKVVDEETKEPLVVWHGTPYGQFYKFDYKHRGKGADYSSYGDYGKGFYFSSSEDVAKSYAYDLPIEHKRNPYVFEGFLNIKNPLNLNTISKIDKKNIELAKKYGIFNIPENEFNDLLKSYKITEESYYEMKKLEDNISDNYTDFDISSLGYNGVIDRKRVEFVAVEPNQIKLADGTNTTFDGTNPDIRYDEGGKIGTIKIDGNEGSEDELMEIYQDEMYSDFFNLNPKKIEYNGNDKEIKEIVKGYNKEISPYFINGKLKDNYMKAIVQYAFNKFSFRKFGDAYRKNISKGFNAENNSIGLTRGYTWKEKASYIIADGLYNDEISFRGFAKDLGITIPPNKS